MAATVGLAFAGQGAIAEDSGSFSTTTVLTTSYEVLQLTDLTTFAGSAEGHTAVTQSSGNPFPVGSQSEVKCLSFGQVTKAESRSQAACSMSTEEDSLLHLTSERTGPKGQIALLGGTGMYEGITGACEYTLTIVAATVAVTYSDCQWERQAGN